jgi:hypothetical protein
MASPHLAATVALMWSAAPALAGDVAGTRAILDRTAVDTADASCGGTAANNNVWGEGRLDAFAAVDQSPRGATGTLQGTVTDGSSGGVVAGATVEISGATGRMTTTDAVGNYSLRLPVGTYTVSARSFGYETQTATGVVVSDAATTVRSFALAPAPSDVVSGHVVDQTGAPVANATVTILETPLAAVSSDAAGFYSFASVPDGTYQAKATAGRCTDAQTQPLTVGGPTTLDFSLAARRDAFGYTCQITTPALVDANTVVPLTGDDTAVQVTLPFAFPFYGTTRSTAWVSTNGFINFAAAQAQYTNLGIPTAALPNAAVYAFWDDLMVDAAASVRTELLGAAPNRRFVIEWRNVTFFGGGTARVRFEMILQENGQILFQYADLADGRELGNSATVGIENDDGTVALQYSFNEAALDNGLAVLLRAGPRTTGTVQGRVTNANDNLGVAGALVRALQNGAEQARTNTGTDGSYSLDLRPGTYTVEASAANYGTSTGQAAIAQADQFVSLDFSLPTARADVSPASLELLLPTGKTRSRSLTIASTGSAALTWTLRESPAVTWLTQSPATGTLPAGSSQTVTVSASTVGLATGIYQTTLVLDSNSGRQPAFNVPVRLIVPAYDQAVNVGGSAYTDAAGDVWAADRSSSGSWGFTQSGPVVTTALPIAGTPDGRIYQDARTGRVEYRFEGLPSGTYAVELRFAEIQGRGPGQRVFDAVVAGDQQVSLSSHDIASVRGTFAADDNVLFVRVRDRLQISFVSRVGEPIVNAIRVTQRPDR